jgi:hypothetical protein
MPVQQSYELRKNRVEIVRLKKLLLFHDIPFDIDETDGLPTPTADSQYGDASRHYGNRRGIRQRQKRFGGKEWSDNIYFGSPGMASVLNEVRSVSYTDQSKLTNIACKHRLWLTSDADSRTPSICYA